MFKTTKRVGVIAAGAFAIALLSAPFVSTANAGGDHGGHGHYKVVKKKHWNHGRHHDHYGHKHYRKKQVRKHRRMRHAHQHAHGIPHRHGPKKVYTVVKYKKKHNDHYRTDNNRLVNEIIEALIRSQVSVYR